jgi:hypothetical protein
MLKTNTRLLAFYFGMVLLATSCQKEPLSELSQAQPDAIQSEITAARSCGMAEHMEELMKNPDYRAFHELKYRIVENAPNRGRATCTNKILIPVAVHYQRLRGSFDEQCLRDLAQNQIDILNADYGGTNIDISNWNNSASAYFPGINNGEACLEFCIATQNHPGGYGLSDGDPAVTFNATRRENEPDWAGYLNIYVKDIQYLGYSPLGGSGNGDGVVIDDQAFGSVGNGCGSISPGAPYNLGRTLTHELGHYLLLDHIWGGGCNRDDGISDTPNSASEYYGCPPLGAASCNSTDMHMNYMDYTNDACMYMFTEGQVGVMESYATGALAALVANGAIVCGDGTPPPPPPADCTTPTGISDNVNKKKVTISWDAQAGTTFEVRYRTVGSTSWTTVSTSSNSVTLNGTPNGNYEYQVRAICGSTTTDWSTPLGTFSV